MAFLCQRDSYLKEVTTKVVACQPAKRKLVLGGKKQNVSGFTVELEESVFFPEGGGQPGDHGQVNDATVLDVQRSGPKALLFVDKRLDVESTAHCNLDWTRRYDHMQHHTGQHLISAVFETHGMNTVSWELGRELCYIEVDVASDDPRLDRAVLDGIEDEMNLYIQDRRHVTVVEFDKGSCLFDNFRTRGLPEDAAGPFRMVEIAGLDQGLCCGTHLKSLGELQCVKLLDVERSKSTQSKIWFTVGRRMRQYMQQMFSREKVVCQALKSSPSEIPNGLETMQEKLKSSKRCLVEITDSLRDLELQRVKEALLRSQALVFVRHKGVGGDFLNYLVTHSGIEASAQKGAVLGLFVAETNPTDGQIVIVHSDEFVSDGLTELKEALELVGNSRGNRFQGKCRKLQALPRALELLQSRGWVLKCD
ncbi:MAG: uncharacterized protein KVP18_002703 [Porospora cf. gigantea A]|uniref:uncharacterized protein n=1 Tax=Porospora cf. gigantea A TaxID=2853593 RepID=UPI00355A2ACA|nr:MAG: hypothetical protein KVP18_002703 [Porospora cf. gigantea A]